MTNEITPNMTTCLTPNLTAFIASKAAAWEKRKAAKVLKDEGEKNPLTKQGVARIPISLKRGNQLTTEQYISNVVSMIADDVQDIVTGKWRDTFVSKVKNESGSLNLVAGKLPTEFVNRLGALVDYAQTLGHKISFEIETASDGVLVCWDVHQKNQHPIKNHVNRPLRYSKYVAAEK